MTYRLLYTQEAARQISKLNGSVKPKIQAAILRLADRPELGKRLSGVLSDRRSYHSGDWRILYKIRRQELLILILTISHRREV